MDCERGTPKVLNKTNVSIDGYGTGETVPAKYLPAVYAALQSVRVPPHHGVARDMFRHLKSRFSRAAITTGYELSQLTALTPIEAIMVTQEIGVRPTQRLLTALQSGQRLTIDGFFAILNGQENGEIEEVMQEEIHRYEVPAAAARDAPYRPSQFVSRDPFTGQLSTPPTGMLDNDRVLEDTLATEERMAERFRENARRHVA